MLTGIAVSRKTDKAYTQCAELQDALEDRGYYETDTHIFSGDNGLTYSPGYKGDRVYCYIYRSNAPDKSPAPRDWFFSVMDVIAVIRNSGGYFCKWNEVVWFMMWTYV